MRKSNLLPNALTLEGGAGWIERSSTGASKLGMLTCQTIAPSPNGTTVKTILRSSFFVGSSTSALIGASSSRVPFSVKVNTMNTPATTKNMYMVSRLAGISSPRMTSKRMRKAP